MARIIGIDYGSKRIGIAVTDPMQLIASPLRTLPVQEVLPFLKKYIATEETEAIVVGLPLQLDGKLGKSGLRAQQFMRLLGRHFPTISIWAYDERFTSAIAQKSLILAGYKKKKRQEKGLLDSISATLILRSYISSPSTALAIANQPIK